MIERTVLIVQYPLFLMKPLKRPVIVQPNCSRPEFPGILNPSALNRPAPAPKPPGKSYAEIARLCDELSSVKAEHDKLKAIFDEKLKGPHLNAFCQFKKWISEFGQRLHVREFELSAFASYIDSFRREPHPTFIEVDAARVKKPRFDSVTVSLLVSNPQRYSFNTPDLVKQNHELQLLVEEQQTALELLKARLNLFTSAHNHNAMEIVKACLAAGIVPKGLAGNAPTQALELKTKRKLLMATLAQLVADRRELTKARLDKRMKLRRHRLRMRMAVKVQSAARGFLVRHHRKQMIAAAITIQRIWRGFIVRWEHKLAMEEMEMRGYGGEERKMRKVTKTRVNPDGTEQEYYDYEYDDDNQEIAPNSSASSIVTEEVDDMIADIDDEIDEPDE
jgi:hypothetical protein